MTQAATTSTPEVFHPDALAALASGRDDQPAWHERALCAQTDPEAFFPEKGSSTREAKQICGRCPVRTECLEDALRRDERFGVNGHRFLPDGGHEFSPLAASRAPHGRPAVLPSRSVG